MAGIAGVFHRDGRPSFIDMLVDGESVPASDARLAIAFDGRLDNRNDLIDRLADGAETSPSGSDADIVLRAYERWGEACPGHLTGDFAFAIWSGPTRTIFCARDPLGVRPFFYHASDRLFLWGSELRWVVADRRVSRDINEGMVAEYLSGFVRDLSETLYRSVRRLAPGHTLTLDSTELRIRRYWSPNPSAALRYRDDDEYADHFQELFREAVACRLRGPGDVALWLSGGLDSASIAGVAQQVRAASGGPRIETFSLVFPDRPEADETRYISDVVGKWGLPSQRHLPRPPVAADYRRQVEERLDIPDFANDELGKPVLAAMRARGCRISLTGFGGDQTLTGSPYRYADLLRHGRLSAFARQLRHDRRRDAMDVVRHGIWPIVPEWTRRVVRPFARRFGTRPPVAPWVGRALVERVSLLDRMQPPPSWSGWASLAGWDAAGEITSGWTALVLEMNARQTAEYGIENRYPFLDRRFVEFALSLPDDQRARGSLTKVVLRHAMRDVLPDSVRQRRDKADFTYSVVTSLEALGGAAYMRALPIAREGWIDQVQITRMYDRMLERHRCGDPAYATDAVPLWMAAGISLWYEMMAGPRVATPRPLEANEIEDVSHRRRTSRASV